MRTIYATPLKPIWLKAAVAGSLWASVEIIIGSFLHNMKIPFSGTILSFIGVYLMVAFFQVWKERGLILRAGMICALMKSISPSAVILGPMIGIMTEAVMLELFILFAGRNLAAYLLAGGVAVFSTLIHMIISFLILYGSNLVRMADDLYHFLLRQLNLPSLSSIALLVVLGGIYFLAGMVAAVLGYLTGKNYVSGKGKGDMTTGDLTLQGERFFRPTPGRQDSLWYLLLNIVVVVATLSLANLGFLPYALILAAVYLVFCIYRYRNTLRRLGKISIWIQFIMIVLTAGFLWKGITSGEIFGTEGLLAGLKMVFRAIVLILGFSAISVELKNPILRSILYRKGFASLYQSLGLAFSALPGIAAGLPGKSKGIGKNLRAFPALFRKAEALYELFENEHHNRPPVIILTGELRQGKTTFARKLVEKLAERGISLSGFLSTGLDAAGQRKGFDLELFPSGKRMLLCRQEPKEGWTRIGRFWFDPGALATGNDILSAATSDSSGVVLVDEVGALELNRQGWSPGIEQLLRKPRVIPVWVVRKKFLEPVVYRWDTGDVFIFDIGIDTVEKVVGRIEALSFEL